MKRTTSHEEGKQRSFDCYCKRILKHEAIDIQRHNQYLNTVQVSLSELTQSRKMSCVPLMNIQRTIRISKSLNMT